MISICSTDKEVAKMDFPIASATTIRFPTHGWFGLYISWQTGSNRVQNASTYYKFDTVAAVFSASLQKNEFLQFFGT